jgi:hypothetical protein
MAVEKQQVTKNPMTNQWHRVSGIHNATLSAVAVSHQALVTAVAEFFCIEYVEIAKVSQ